MSDVSVAVYSQHLGSELLVQMVNQCEDDAIFILNWILLNKSKSDAAEMIISLIKCKLADKLNWVKWKE